MWIVLVLTPIYTQFNYSGFHFLFHYPYIITLMPKLMPRQDEDEEPLCWLWRSCAQ